MKKLLSVILSVIIIVGTVSVNFTAMAEEQGTTPTDVTSTSESTTEPTSESTTEPTSESTTEPTSESSTTLPTVTVTESSSENTSITEPTTKPIVKVSSIKLNRTSYRYNKTRKNGHIKLTATVSPANANNKAVKWTSNNRRIATVDSNGIVTMKSKGIAYITAKATDGSNIYARGKITIVQRATALRLNRYHLYLKKGKSSTLKSIIYPVTVSNKRVSWTTSNTRVATVKNGKVLAKGKGACRIIATTRDGSKKRISCIVVVGQRVNKISLNKSKLTMYEGNRYKLKATASPKTASYKAVGWTSSNNKVATVNTKGVVTAKKKGSAYITAKAKDGSRKYARCKVTVRSADDKPLSEKEWRSYKNVKRLCDKLNNWYKSQGAIIDKSMVGQYQWYHAQTSLTTSINYEYYALLDFFLTVNSGDELNNDGDWIVTQNGKKVNLKVKDVNIDKYWEPYWDWVAKIDDCDKCKYKYNMKKYRKTVYCNDCKKLITDGEANGWKEHIKKWKLHIYVHPEKEISQYGNYYDIKFYYK